VSLSLPSPHTHHHTELYTHTQTHAPMSARAHTHTHTHTHTPIVLPEIGPWQKLHLYVDLHSLCSAFDEHPKIELVVLASALVLHLVHWKDKQEAPP